MTGEKSAVPMPLRVPHSHRSWLTVWAWHYCVLVPISVDGPPCGGFEAMPDNELEDEHLDIVALAHAVRERRSDAGLSTRKAGEAAGVSFMTLARVESGGRPDFATFLRLCAWLAVPPETFFLVSAVMRLTTPDVIAGELRNDPLLVRSDASQIVSVVRGMYAALAATPPVPMTVVAHWRAPTAMQPGVPEHVTALLADMHASLEASEALAPQ